MTAQEESISRMEIDLVNLQLTREGYFAVFDRLRKKGMGLKQTYDRVDEICSEKGFLNYYSSFESFKAAHYLRKRNDPKYRY